MAYSHATDKKFFTPIGGQSARGNAPAMWAYKTQDNHAAVDAAGGTAALWDGWCSYVAARQPERYQDADVVSALHVAALGLKGLQVSELLGRVPGFSHADPGSRSI